MDSPRKPLLQTDVSPAFKWLARRWICVPFAAGLIALSLVLVAALELYYYFIWYFGLQEPGKVAMLQKVAPMIPEVWQIGMLLLLPLVELAIARPSMCFRALSHPAVIIALLLLSLALMMPAWNLMHTMPMASSEPRWKGTELCWTLVLCGLAWRLIQKIRAKLRRRATSDSPTTTA